MKNIFLALLFTVGAMAPIAPARANDWGKTPQEHQEKLNKMMDKWTKEMSLSPDQQTKIRAILQNKVDKMTELKNSTDQQIRALLNPEQTKKYEKLKD